jgi:hypothetical protein
MALFWKGNFGREDREIILFATWKEIRSALLPCGN